MTDRLRLIVMRHAKAEPFAATDFERSLTDRGVRAATEAGEHLRERGLVPDLALVSSSQRTRQTWSALAEGADATDCEVTFEDAAYTGSADVVLEALQAVPPGARTVLFVGHNPTAAFLCHLLDDGAGDPEAVSGLLTGFPPAALAVFEVAVPWTGLGSESGRLVGYHVGGA